MGNSPISRVTLVAAFHRSQEAEAARAKILAERALRKERAEQRAQEEAAAAEARAQARQASQASREGGGVDVSISVKSLLQRCGWQRSKPCRREQLWLCAIPVCLSRQKQFPECRQLGLCLGRQLALVSAAGFLQDICFFSSLDLCTSW